MEREKEKEKDKGEGEKKKVKVTRRGKRVIKAGSINRLSLIQINLKQKKINKFKLFFLKRLKFSQKK